MVGMTVVVFGAIVVVGAIVVEDGAVPPGVSELSPNQARVSVSCSGTVWPTP